MAKPVPRLTPYYVERPEIYESIVNCLNINHSEGQKLYVLCGMAGTGKTQLSSYYKHRNYKKYVRF